MKSTGIVRRVEPLGRIVIPKELRRTLSLNEGDPMEIFTIEDKIILRKYSAVKSCVITGEVLDSNVEYLPGLVLSPTGAATLLNELKKTVNS